MKLCADLHKQVSQFSGSQFTTSDRKLARHEYPIKGNYISFFDLGLDLHPNSECRPAKLWPISVGLMTGNVLISPQTNKPHTAG